MVSEIFREDTSCLLPGIDENRNYVISLFQNISKDKTLVSILLECCLKVFTFEAYSLKTFKPKTRFLPIPSRLNTLHRQKVSGHNFCHASLDLCHKYFKLFIKSASILNHMYQSQHFMSLQPVQKIPVKEHDQALMVFCANAVC